MPTLLHCQKPMHSSAVHSVEAFGPVSTVLPYDTADEAIELARMGEGSLAGSIITSDDAFAREVVLGSCSMCHAREPVWEGMYWPPKGVVLETEGDLARRAREVYLQAGVSHAMPPAVIAMDDEARAALRDWYRAATR